MRRIAVVSLLFAVSFDVTVGASEYDILRPGGVQDNLDVKRIESVQRRMMATNHLSRPRTQRSLGPHGIIDTITWRSKAEPDVNFGFLTGDSLLVWFKPVAACSLIAIRFYPVNWEGSTLIDVWNGSRYDPQIFSSDSVDTNGWIGTFEPITDPTNWISGMWDHSPLGGSALDPAHHYWGPFPYTVTRNHAKIWVEIPTGCGLQGEIDLGSDPFYISHVYYQTAGWGFGSEYPWMTPYNFFKFYSAITGPDGVHNGWYIRSYFMWYEAVVRYYENTPPSIKSLKVQNDTYDTGTLPITATITDNDAEDGTRAGVASAELVHDINGAVDSVGMEGPPEGGRFTANIPKLAVGDVVTYWVEATDPTGLSSQSRKITFARIEPDHPAADILIVWDYENDPDLDTFYVDLFDLVSTDGRKYEFELWNIRDREGIDASVINWGWRTIIVSGWDCGHSLPGRDYTGNPFVEWLDSGTTVEPHNLLYIDQDYFCAHPEYDCSWDGELTDGDFLHDYFGVKRAISDNHGSEDAGYDSVAVGTDGFEGIRVNFLPDAWDLTQPERYLWPDWLVELTDDAEYILKYADQPLGTGSGAGVRLDRGTFKTIFLPWQDFFAVDSLENGDLVPRPDLVEMYERILAWFGTSTSTGTTPGLSSTPNDFALMQNYPNPCNPTTRIHYTLPVTGPIHTTLRIYNILGQEVRMLVDERQAPGKYTIAWDGRDNSGFEVPSGVYFYRLKTEPFAATRRMLLLR